MPYRILSLDGGGSWALIQVRTLRKIYGPDVFGHEVLKRFDLVAANSGGSIVAAGLALNFKLSDLEDLFLNEVKRKQVFVRLPWYDLPWFAKLIGIGARYSAEKKRIGLKNVLGAGTAKTLPIMAQELESPGSIGKRVDFLITAFDYDRRRAVFFRSNSNSLAASFPHEPWSSSLLDAVHAASNAPVRYFDRPAEEGDFRYWDGAVSGLNNPVFAAVVEALANGVRASDMEVLSIGTGSLVLPQPIETVQPPLAAERQDPGLLNDLREMATSILDDPPDAASFHAHVALGQILPPMQQNLPVNGSVFRLNPLIQPIHVGEGYELPPGYTDTTFANLAKLDMDAIENDEVTMISDFCNAWMRNEFPNQPIRANRKLDCEIGYPRFLEAIAAWKQRTMPPAIQPEKIGPQLANSVTDKAADS